METWNTLVDPDVQPIDILPSDCLGSHRCVRAIIGLFSVEFRIFEEALLIFAAIAGVGTVLVMLTE